MSDTLQNHPERQTLEMAQGVIFCTAIGLIEQDYPPALTSEAATRYAEEIPNILQRTVDSGLNRFALRLTMASTIDQVQDPDTIKWFAMFMKPIVNQENGSVRCLPSGSGDTIDYMCGLTMEGMELNMGLPSGSRILIFELGWADVKSDFDPNPYLD